MAGYKIDFAEATQAAEALDEILESFAHEIEGLSTIEEDLLSEANWTGPNKSVFTAGFATYKEAAVQLLRNGGEHLDALRGIIGSYANAEQV